MGVFLNVFVGLSVFLVAFCVVYAWVCPILGGVLCVFWVCVCVLLDFVVCDFVLFVLCVCVCVRVSEEAVCFALLYVVLVFVL